MLRRTEAATSAARKVHLGPFLSQPSSLRNARDSPGKGASSLQSHRPCAREEHMMARVAQLALAVSALGLSPGITLAGEPFVPSWIKNDPSAKTVVMEIVADWNQVARYAKDNIRTDIIDFNGYWGGNLTIMVPTGWSVRIEFINGSLSFRHSLTVTRVYAQAEMPVKLEKQDAIWGAYTDPPEGISTHERRQLNFVAQ